MPPPAPSTPDPFWIFAYGSLMWRPGFDFVEAIPATLRGYHRSFCVYSHHHRGTPERPGLVLGLAPGGSCRGVALRAAAEAAESVRAYLDERELIGYAYVARVLEVEIDNGRVDAYAFVADPDHRHFAGELDVDAAAAIILEAQGVAGLNREYLINTIRQLERDGFTDHGLHALRLRVEALTGEIEAGGGI